MEEAKKTFWDYGVSVRGVKKKCRKVDHHIVTLSKDHLEVIEEDARRLAREWIEKNMKSVVNAIATATMWTDSGDGVKTWQPFTDSHNLKFYL